MVVTFLFVNMWQSEVTEYFHSRKRNGNFQPSKRQKVQAETYNSDVANSGTLLVGKASSTKKTNSSAVQTKSAKKIPDSRKHTTRSRIPKLQKESLNIRLDDIWKKSCDLNAREDLVFTEVTQNRNISPSKLSSQHVRSSLSDNQEHVLPTTVNTRSTVSDNRLPVSPSKRHRQNDAEESGPSTVSDVATEVIDDHGNSHPCTPSKRRPGEHGIAAAATNNKRGRCLVATNSSNYYQTPYKFDFSPYHSNISTPRSLSARKKLVLCNANVTKSPTAFVFKGRTDKSPETSVAIKAKEKSFTDVQKDARDVTELSDKAERDEEETEAADETVLPAYTGLKTAETPCKNVVKIGTCRSLEQLKKKIRDLSPRKAKVSDTIDDASHSCQRYT